MFGIERDLVVRVENQVIEKGERIVGSRVDRLVSTVESLAIRLRILEDRNEVVLGRLYDRFLIGT
mgnify:CR=1 FL=1